MTKQATFRTEPSALAPAAVVLGAAALVALAIGFQLGEWRNVALAAIGLFGLAAAFGTAQFPLLGLVGVSAITAGNLSDVLQKYWGAPPITHLIIPGLVFMLAYRWIARGERPFFHAGALAAIGVFLTMILLSSLHAHSFAVALEDFDSTIRNMVIVLLTLCFFSYSNSLRYLGLAVVAIGVFTAIVAIYKYGITGDLANEYRGFARVPRYGGFRFAGTDADPNEYGAVLVMMMPFAMDRAFWSEKLWMRLAGFAAVAALLASILLTGSRGTLLAMAAGALLYGLTLPRRMALPFFGVGTAALVVMLGLLSEQVIARFSTLIDLAETGAPTDSGVEGRLGAWAVAVQLFYDHPFFGVGAGNFNVLYQTTANDLGIIFGGRDLSPHGLYLQILAEYGVVGLSVYLAILFFAGRGVLRAMAMLRDRGADRARALCAAFGVALASHLVAMIFLHGPGARLTWIFIVVAIALPAIVRHRLDGRSHGAGQSAEGGLPL